MPYASVRLARQFEGLTFNAFSRQEEVEHVIYGFDADPCHISYLKQMPE